MSTAPTAGDKDLNNLWGAALDGMINVPTYLKPVLYLAPAESIRAESLEKLQPWPAPFLEGRRVYSLTAHNPMGVTVSEKENKAANAILAKKIVDGAFGEPKPFAQWMSFGFHVVENWREDGFTLSFNATDSEQGKQKVLTLAHEFKQAAIYEYVVDKEANLLRRVVWCDPEKQHEMGDEETVMLAVMEVPDSELAKGVVM